MEFERALFRIHQRALYSAPLRQVRVQAERWLPWVCVASASCLALLHADYVGQARCLPEVLKHAGLWNATTEQPAIADDVLLALTVTAGDELLEGGFRLQMDAPPPQPPAVSAGPPAAGDLAQAVQPIAPDAGGVRASDGFAIAAQTAKVAEGGGRKLGVAGPARAPPVAVYRFALDREVILMRKSVFEGHHFEVKNISLPEACIAPSWALSEVLRWIGALDGIIINELAYSFRSRGFLERVEGDTGTEYWTWSKEQLETSAPDESRTFIASFWRKVLLALKSVITFLCISSISGFFIRVAVNGSAVLMFPMALLAQATGSSSSHVSLGVLTRSFPWIGVHVDLLRRAGQSVWPLFRAHIVFLLFQSFAYLSCNLAWRFILYRKSSPEGFEERVFSFCSVLELFNLIFVRSTNSAVVFPKLATAIMVYLHFYIFCSLYPFHMLALVVAAAFCVYVMVYCLNHFEEPALCGDPFSHSTPTAAHPRALYMPQLSPSWTLESAPLWSMFYLPEPPSAFPTEAMRSISNEEYAMP